MVQARNKQQSKIIKGPASSAGSQSCGAHCAACLASEAARAARIAAAAAAVRPARVGREDMEVCSSACASLKFGAVSRE